MKTLLGATMLAAVSILPAQAQSQAPIMSFHTQRYEMVGAENVFSFVLGATKDTYVEIDFGFGPVEYAVGIADIDSSTGTINGTFISGQVGPEGMVRVYGDASEIDFVDIEGVYADELDISQLVNLDVLNIRHNLIPELDLSPMKRLSAVYLDDNPFDRKPLVIGSDHPNLTIIEMESVGALDQSFNISDYPNLMSFSAYHTLDLRSIDPTGCSKLLRLSLDCTNVESVDLSQNPELRILSVSQTKVTEVDLSANTKLQQFYATKSGVLNNEYKLKTLDVSMCPDLVYLFAADNLFTELDITGNPNLIHLSIANNYLTGIDFSGSPDLYQVDIANNNMDYVTMPAPRETIREYYYKQRAIPFERSYAVGTELDLTSRLERQGSTTTARLICGDQELSDEYYTYSDGLIEFYKETPDSVYLQFDNTLFVDYPLTSSKFVVKSVADYGKDVAMVTYRLRPAAGEVSLSVGMAGATAENPKRFSVDFGDGNPVDFTTTTNLLPADPNATGAKKAVGAMTLYIPEGEDLTAFGIDGIQLSAIDVTAARSLGYLSVTDCGVGSINLKYNRCLRYLNLNGNALESLDLTGTDDMLTSKNLLAEVYANSNRLTSFTTNENRTPRVIELADNRLTEFSLSKASYIERVNLAGNQLTEINLQDCEALTSLDLAGNDLATIEIPEYTPLEELNLSLNRFPLSKLPQPGVVARYTYAPQKEWMMPEMAPSCSLAEQMVTVGDNKTEFKWYSADGRELTSDEVSGNNGKFTFKKTDMGQVYAEWTNAAYPDFTGANIYRSTLITPADSPTHVAATFTTAKAADGTLIMTSAVPNNYVYIDWAGDGDLEQYRLNDKMYTIFPVKAYANTEVKVYTYDDRDAISVFSVGGLTLSQIDLSAMTDLFSLNLGGTGLSAKNMKLPATELRELTLSGCDVEGVDFSAYPTLEHLVLRNSGLAEFDASVCSKLQSLVVSDNPLTSLKLDNPVMWELMATGCELETIDLNGVPAMEQLFLTSNSLRELDLSMLRNLKVLDLSNNCFTLTTLPRVLSTYNIYYYSNQALYKVTILDGNRIDLSDQLMVGTNRTSYRWFRDRSAYLAEDGTIAGDELTAGTDYLEEDGVFTFLTSVPDALCVMTNAAFPNLIYLTDPIDITVSGVEQISDEIDLSFPVEVYDLSGVKVSESVNSLLPGIYIVRQGEKSLKISVR